MEEKIQEVLERLDPQASAYFKQIIPEYKKGYLDYIYQSEDYSVQARRLKYISKLFQAWQKKPWFYLMPLTQHSAEVIAHEWHYPQPYDFYDLAADPDDFGELLSPELRQNSYFQVIRNGILFGFACFDLQGSELEIGLGMAPDWTGQSYGAAFLKAIEDYAQTNYQVETLVLNVATFNSRAIKLYENLGYQAESTFKQATNGSVYDLIRMTKAVDQAKSSKN